MATHRSLPSLQAKDDTNDRRKLLKKSASYNPQAFKDDGEKRSGRSLPRQGSSPLARSTRRLGLALEKMSMMEHNYENDDDELIQLVQKNHKEIMTERNAANERRTTERTQHRAQAKQDPIDRRNKFLYRVGKVCDPTGRNSEKRSSRSLLARQRSAPLLRKSQSARLMSLEKMSIAECSDEDSRDESSDDSIDLGKIKEEKTKTNTTLEKSDNDKKIKEEKSKTNTTLEKSDNDEKMYDENDEQLWRLDNPTGSIILCDESGGSFCTIANQSFISQLSLDAADLESSDEEEVAEGNVKDDEITVRSKIDSARASMLIRSRSRKLIENKGKRANQTAFQSSVRNIMDDRSTELEAFPVTDPRISKADSGIARRPPSRMLLPFRTKSSENDLFKTISNIGAPQESRDSDDLQTVKSRHTFIRELSFKTRSSQGSNSREWIKIRTALMCLNPAEAKDEIENVNNEYETVLHICCRNFPPLDIIDTILATSCDLASMSCARENLPLHVECQHGANLEIIKKLIKAYPDGVSAVNAEGKTPLHLACRNKSHPPSFEVLHLLMTSSSESMSAVEIINSVDGRGESPITLEYLCQRVTSRYEPGLMNNSLALSCLAAYLDAKLELCYLPNYAEAISCIALLEESPSWFRETAAVHPYVRAILNWRITRTFSVGTLLMDGYINLMLIVCFRMASFESRTARFVAATAAQSCVEENACMIEDGYGNKKLGGVPIALLYVGAMYMSLRELLQATSMAYRGEFKHWLLDFWNWADCFSITLILISTTQMYYGSGDDDTFRLLTIITTGFLWVEALSILKTINHNFAVFISGLSHMALALRPFLGTMCLFLVAFAQMYLSNYQATDSCPIPTNTDTSSLSAYSLQNNFCTLMNSYIKVYMMFVGNGVNESEFMNDFTSLMLSVTFSFVILILLLNILIAIVTDSYGVIAKKSENVFWCERMSFVFEVDQTYTFLGTIIEKIHQTVFFFNNDIDDNEDATRDFNKFGESTTAHVLTRNLSLLWDIAMIVFKDPTSVNAKKLEDDLKRRWRPVGLLKHINPNKFLSSMIQSSWMRFGVAIFLPFWILLGFLSASILWPPQVKRWLLCPCVKEGSNSEQVTKMDMEDISDEVRQNFGIMGDQMRDDWNDVHSRIDEAYAGMERIEEKQRQIKNEVLGIRSEMCDMHNSIRDIKNLLTEVVNRTNAGMINDPLLPPSRLRPCVSPPHPPPPLPFFVPQRRRTARHSSLSSTKRRRGSPTTNSAVNSSPRSITRARDGIWRGFTNRVGTRVRRTAEGMWRFRRCRGVV